jgi:hypothetical protein
MKISNHSTQKQILLTSRFEFSIRVHETGDFAAFEELVAHHRPSRRLKTEQSKRKAEKWPMKKVSLERSH